MSTWDAIRTVTSADDAPTLKTEGSDVEVATRYAVLVTGLDTITSYTVELWVAGGPEVGDDDGDSWGWSMASQQSYSLGDETFAETFDVEDYGRAFLRVSAIVGTSVAIYTRSS